MVLARASSFRISFNLHLWLWASHSRIVPLNDLGFLVAGSLLHPLFVVGHDVLFDFLVHKVRHRLAEVLAVSVRLRPLGLDLDLALQLGGLLLDRVDSSLAVLRGLQLKMLAIFTLVELLLRLSVDKVCHSFVLAPQLLEDLGLGAMKKLFPLFLCLLNLLVLLLLGLHSLFGLLLEAGGVPLQFLLGMLCALLLRQSSLLLHVPQILISQGHP